MTVVLAERRSQVFAICLTAMTMILLSVVMANTAAAEARGLVCPSSLSVQDRAACLEKENITSAPVSMAKMALPETLDIRRVSASTAKDAEKSTATYKEASAGIFSPLPLLLFGAAFVCIIFLGRRRNKLRQEGR